MTEHTQPGTVAVPEGVREAEMTRRIRALCRDLAQHFHESGTLDVPLPQVLEGIDSGKYDKMIFSYIVETVL